MTDASISKALVEAIPVLNSTGVDYWLGRGVLRNIYIRGKIGGSNSDLDFHIWKNDAESVKEALISLFKSNHENLVVDERHYKIAFYTPIKEGRHEFFVEFMYLNKAGDYVFHERNDGKRYANAECFLHDRTIFIEFDGQYIRIPALVDEYLLGTYGPNWKDNKMKDKKFKSTPEFLQAYKYTIQAQ